MSEPQAVTVNVNSGGGRRQRGPGLFSNLGRAPWYVQLVLLIVIGYIVIIVGFEVLAAVYDFSVPTFFDFFQDPRSAGAGLGAAISAFLGGIWSSTGARAGGKLESSGLNRYAQNLPSVKIANWLFKGGSGGRGGGGGF
jgi:hypothetical protein